MSANVSVSGRKRNTDSPCPHHGELFLLRDEGMDVLGHKRCLFVNDIDRTRAQHNQLTEIRGIPRRKLPCDHGAPI